ncbi:MAG: radical SAM protein [Nitrospirales bacterium]|nr:radical SAM protein [Nitrospira sp.]MDR4485199.1 radical SAM protein [Nitrospirales bacterium]
MGKALPVINSFLNRLNSLGSSAVSKFESFRPDSGSPGDGRTVDDFKPYLVALNLTKRCNLKCEHCYLDATTKMGGGHDELTTEECFRLIDQIAQVNAGSLLVITGGEPLVRPDILEIARHAVEQRFMVVFGTNGMLIDDKMAKAMVDIGVMGVGISIDSLDSATHNAFRGLPGAWEGAMAGIEACKRNGLQFQVHFSAQPMNYKELPAVIDWSHDLGAKVLNVFFMVCTGRGEELTDITPAQYEEVLTYLVESQDKYQDMLVRARCAPHFKRLAYENDPNSPITKAQGYMGGGCLAGTNYARVTPNGDLTPCPYMPLSAGNIRNTSFVDLWDNSEVFKSFRYPHLKGKCGDCEYSEICGGCRARPYVDHGDAMDEDEWCLYTPKGGDKIKVAFNVPEASSVEWEADAEERLSRIPYFLRAMVKKGVERHAAEQGIPVVTIDLMEELRKRRFGNEKPVFKL